MKNRVTALAIWICCYSIPLCCATLTFYSDRSSWQAATPGYTNINFEGLTGPCCLNSLNIPVPPGLTLSGVNFSTSRNTTNEDCGSPTCFFVAPPGSYSPGNAVLTYVESPAPSDTIVATLPGAGGWKSIAFDFGNVITPHTMMVSLSTGDSFTRITTPSCPGTCFGGPSGLSFVGFTSSAPITFVQISELSTHTDVFNMDNFAFGQPAGAGVPEPSA